MIGVLSGKKASPTTVLEMFELDEMMARYASYEDLAEIVRYQFAEPSVVGVSVAKGAPSPAGGQYMKKRGPLGPRLEVIAASLYQDSR